MTELLPGSPFHGAGGSGVDVSGGVMGLVAGDPTVAAEAFGPESGFEGSGGSGVDVGGGAVGIEAGASLDAWQELTTSLGRSGPAKLDAARRLRHAQIARLQRLGPVG